MGTRLLDYIIDDVRESTENQDFSDTNGIQESEFVRFINNAQYRLQNLIVNQHPKVFTAEYVVNITSNTEEYTLPDMTFLGNKVTQVEYSPTTSDRDYYPLRPASLYNRNYNLEGDPDYYIRRNGKILLLPTPNNSGGKLRISYVKKVPKVDLRRGLVSAVTLGANSITSLTIDTTDVTTDATEIAKWTRMCVVDEEGNINMRNIKFTSYDSSTGVFTIDSSFTFDSGETIEVGNWIVMGPYSSSFLELPDEVERYIIDYASAYILHRDSSSDLNAQLLSLKDMESDIINSYAEIDDDIIEIPMINNTESWDWE